TRALFFANDANNAGTLEIVDVTGGAPHILAASVSDQALRLDESDAAGARAYFLGTGGSINAIGLDGVGASTLKAAGAIDVVAVWLDGPKHLRRARLDRGAPELVQISVDTFDVLGRATSTPKVVYSIAAEINAGVWIADP